MDILLVFDGNINFKKLLPFLKPDTHLHLFPLTSNFLLIDELQQKLKHLTTVQINILDSADLINQEVTRMQTIIHHWSATLANYQIKERALKEWFLYPDRAGSAWWLGMIHEKNTVQESVFFNIAQINAIQKQLASTQFNDCIVSVAENMKRQAILQTARNLQIKHVSIKSLSLYPASIKQRMLTIINQYALLAALLTLFVWLKDSLLARLHLSNLKIRIMDAKRGTFTFVSYFPNIDETEAKRGIFINKYAKALQEELAKSNIKITWLLMPVFYNGHRFKSSVLFAKRFITHGEHLFLLQEFFNFKCFCKTIVWWLRHALLSERLLKCLPVELLLQNLSQQETLPYLRYIWRHSFIGVSAMRGIIFYLTYQEYFKAMPQMKSCLYFCEMQAWEKALIMAKKKFSSETTTYAFQHTVIVRNFFNYFYAQEDLVQQGNNFDMPLPDFLLANGQLPYQLLKSSHYPNLRECEAIRQLYLNQIQFPQSTDKTERLLLVVGSCDRQETKSLISMIYASFPTIAQSGFAICFKGSPVNPMAPLFAELNIDSNACGYEICDGYEIAHLLSKATIACVANTTVAIEAKAFGLEVIVPLFADTMLMNPIVETRADYFLVSNVKDFKMIVTTKMDEVHLKTIDRDIIHECFNINPQLKSWKELLIDAHDL